MDHHDDSVQEKDFYRWSLSCREAALARIGEFAAADCNSGWPDRVRCTLSLRNKGGAAACGGQCQGVSRSGATSTVARQPALSDLREAIQDAHCRGLTLIHCNDFVSRSVPGRTRRAVLRRLRSARGRNSLAKAAVGGESSFAFVAEGCTESYQASQDRCQRRRIHLFEPAPHLVTSDITDKILFS
jgi:hypothetical protein